MKPETRERVLQSIAGGWLRVARTRPGSAVNLGLLHLGLHGLGYNHFRDVKQSGEAWFVATVLPSLGVRNAFDIGANEGAYSRLLLESVPGEVTAFEPGDEALAVLRSLEARSAGRLSVHDCAVGASDGTMTLYRSVAASSWSSLHPEVDDGHLGLEPGGEVTVRSVDSILRSGEANAPDFIKIDVEGSEFEVLIGAPDFIASGRLRALQLEFNTHQLAVGHTLRDLAELLPGYRFARIVPNGLIPASPSNWMSNVYQYANVAAIRQDLVPRTPGWSS